MERPPRRRGKTLLLLENHLLRPATAKRSRGPVEKLSPEEILVRLVEEDEDHTENTRYILAVMLERQKLLRETDSQRTPNGILRVYEHRKTGEVYLIRDPDIPLSQVEAVQNEVFVLLENNGRMPEPAAPKPPSQRSDSQAISAAGGGCAGLGGCRRQWTKP